MPGSDTAPGGERLKVPHMGWNRVRQARPHAIWDGIPDDTYFYFVHSYYAVPADPRLPVGETHYGARFNSAVATDNIFALQFHSLKRDRKRVVVGNSAHVRVDYVGRRLIHHKTYTK